MSPVKLNLIVAVSENLGIGKNGDLPWTLKNEMAYFKRMTLFTKDTSKQNAVIMGRKTWESIPSKHRPLAQRLNVVLTKTPDALKSKVSGDVLVFDNFDEAVVALGKNEDIENIWVVGGSSIYKTSIEHPNFHKIYITEIQKNFDCDTFFPEFKNEFKLIEDHSEEPTPVPMEKQVENGLEYYYRIYEKIN